MPGSVQLMANKRYIGSWYDIIISTVDIKVTVVERTGFGLSTQMRVKIALELHGIEMGKGGRYHYDIQDPRLGKCHCFRCDL